MQAADAQRAINICIHDPRACGRSKRCAVHRFLKDVQEDLDDKFRNLTLAEIARQQRVIDGEKK